MNTTEKEVTVKVSDVDITSSNSLSSVEWAASFTNNVGICMSCYSKIL